MKKNFLFVVLYSLIGLLSSCSFGNRSDALNEKVVKIIKTRAYTAKVHFDESTFDEPVYQIGGYQDLLSDIDGSHVWTIQYLDKHNNVLKVERIRLGDGANEEIEMTTINEYFSEEGGLLSMIEKESKLVGQFREKYIRNENGDLLEVIKQHNDEITEKIKFLYNASNQLIKEETYEEGGIREAIEYTYDSPQKDIGKVIRKESENFRDDYRRETDYELSEEGFVLKKRSKYYQDGSLYSEFTTIYEDYIGEIATREIQDGFSGPTLVSENANGTKSEYGGGPKQTLIIKELDAKGNIIKQTEKELGSTPQIQSKIDISSRNSFNNVQMEYAYNDRDEWTRLLFKTGSLEYIIIRDIEYIN